jgi:hypothetical protein
MTGKTPPPVQHPAEDQESEEVLEQKALGK